jgi:hypothetical protein
LNYKISLRQGVEEFVKKESKIDDYQIFVEECSASEENNETRAMINLHEDMDDALYQMTVQVIAKLKSNVEAKPTDAQGGAGGGGANGGGGQGAQQWEKEEEKIKRRLEKSALNSLKFKYATQAQGVPDAQPQ